LEQLAQPDQRALELQDRLALKDRLAQPDQQVLELLAQPDQQAGQLVQLDQRDHQVVAQVILG
jgi:hypothetical protein